MDDERITWTDCPRCGRPAAVGWQIAHRWNGTVREDPVSFDCHSGCVLTDRQIVCWFGGKRGWR